MLVREERVREGSKGEKVEEGERRERLRGERKRGDGRVREQG